MKEVRWLIVMYSFVSDKRYFEVNALLNGKPVKLFENRGDIFCVCSIS